MFMSGNSTSAGVSSLLVWLLLCKSSATGFIRCRRNPNTRWRPCVPMWGATAFAGAWVAGSIGRWLASAIVAVLLLAALAFNVSMLPYTLWFKGVMPMAAIASLALGAWVACKGQGAAAFRSMR